MVLPLRDENPTRRRAIVTIALIAINLVLFVAYEPPAFRAVDNRSVEDLQEDFLYEHAAVPCELTRGHPISQSLARECVGGAQFRQTGNTRPPFPHKNIYFAVILSMFLHASWLHVLFNMLFLWIFGNNVEDRVGPLPYLVLYLLWGLAATAAHVLSAPDSITPVLGASGAIAGVMGAYLVFFPRARIVSIIPVLFFFPFRIPAWVFLIVWFVTQFFTGPNTGVAWVAHVGGFVAGAVTALMIRPWAMRDATPLRRY